MGKRPETHWYIRHPDHKAAINVLTQDNLTAEDVAFDCQEILGSAPTSVALGTPENIVWPIHVAHAVNL